jgi:hypothetical protein
MRDLASPAIAIGKVNTWSGPAMAIGGLLPLIYPSQDFSFLQEAIIAKTVNKIQSKYFS